MHEKLAKRTAKMEALGSRADQADDMARTLAGTHSKMSRMAEDREFQATAAAVVHSSLEVPLTCRHTHRHSIENEGRLPNACLI